MITESLLKNLGFAGAIWLALEWAIRIVALMVVPRNRKPSSGMAWLLAIFFIPVLGLPLYLLISNPKLPKARREAQKNLDRFISATLRKFMDKRGKRDWESGAAVPEKYAPIAKLSEALTHFPVFSGNKVTVIPDYEDVIPRMAADIDKAEHYVQIEFFILTLDKMTEPFFDSVARAVQRGVRVRVLYDAISSRRFPGFKGTMNRLKSDGVMMEAMLPLRIGKEYVRPDLRNHRKIVVIDGHMAYTGSLNIITRNYHRKDDIYYDELVVKTEGPIALQFTAVFATDWYSETKELINSKDLDIDPMAVKSYGNTLAQVLPSGPGYEDENNLKLFTALIHAAQKRIVIVNPYFVPEEALTTAITSATKRGVEVILINSESMDQWMVGYAQRSFYEPLLKAGARIFLYKKPIFLHSKFMIIDDEMATVGSSNMDIRSFELDLEVTLIAYDKKLASTLNKVVNQYLARSKEISLKQWQKRSHREVLVSNIARLTSALQ